MSKSYKLSLNDIGVQSLCKASFRGATLFLPASVQPDKQVRRKALLSYAICALVTQSNDTREFVPAALGGPSRIYIPGYRYAKAGIILSQFLRAISLTYSHLSAGEISETLMKVMDGINARYGRGASGLLQSRLLPNGD